MAHSGRTRHRDAGTRRRTLDDEPPARDRVFQISDAQRQEIATYLRYVDEARRTLEDQRNAAHREIIRTLRVSADQIFDVLSELEETGD